MAEENSTGVDRSVNCKCIRYAMTLILCYWFGFLTSMSTSRLSSERVTSLTSGNFPAATRRQSGETMTSDSADHITLTPTQPVGNGRSGRGSNPWSPDQKSRALSAELRCSHIIPITLSKYDSYRFNWA